MRTRQGASRDLPSSASEPHMATFLEEAASLLSPDLIGKAASAFGVPTDGMQKAMGAAMPAVLGAIASKAEDKGFMGQLFEMATSSAAGGSPADLLGTLTGGAPSPMMDMGKKLVSGLFPGVMGDGMMGAIAKMAGIGSGSGLMGTIGALAISLIGKRVRAGGLNAGSLATALMGEKDGIMKAIPGPIAALMGAGNLAGAAGAFAKAGAAAPSAAINAARGAATQASSGRGWLTPLLGIAALAAAAWFFLGRKPAEPAAPPAPPVVAAEPAPAPAPTVDANGMQLLKLPDGVELQVSPTGIEGQLVAFIQDASKAVDKTTWFNFDRLLYQTGSAKLEPSSMDQLRNIAAIMKAFPNVKLKIGGYTDNVGKAASNLKLSDNRARAAMAELVTMGVGADRLEAEGYGDTVPVADNATEEGRQQNRRTAARVSAK
jgi:OmpA-OmpF porin, OOP family